jgi:hypothetical protein
METHLKVYGLRAERKHTMKATTLTVVKAIAKWQASLPEVSSKAMKSVDLTPVRWTSKGSDLYIWVKASTERYVMTESRSFVLDGTGYADGCYHPDQLGGSKTFVDAPAEHRAAWHERQAEINRYYDGVRKIMRHVGTVTRTVQGNTYQCAMIDTGKKTGNTYIVLSPEAVVINDDISAGMNYPAHNLTTSPIEAPSDYRREGGIDKQDNGALRGYAKVTGSIKRIVETPAPVGYIPTIKREVRVK